MVYILKYIINYKYKKIFLSREVEGLGPVIPRQQTRIRELCQIQQAFGLKDKRSRYECQPLLILEEAFIFIVLEICLECVCRWYINVGDKK